MTHGLSNSCAVSTAYIVFESFTVKKKQPIMLETTTDDNDYILINFDKEFVGAKRIEY